MAEVNFPVTTDRDDTWVDQNGVTWVIIASKNDSVSPDTYDAWGKAAGENDGVSSVVAGTNIAVDATNPAHPIVSSTVAVIDDLTTGGTTDSLSAQQGVVLDGKTGTNATSINTLTTDKMDKASFVVTGDRLDINWS